MTDDQSQRLTIPARRRRLVTHVPERLRPKGHPIAWAMAFDLDGRQVHDLRASAAGYGFDSAVAERDGTLVASSLHEDDVVVLAKPAG